MDSLIGHYAVLDSSLQGARVKRGEQHTQHAHQKSHSLNRNLPLAGLSFFDRK